ncbi:universal stress protein [Candidatus Aminicenantes bacterium AC-335-K20]|nr:universal stress protein [SCandidatus Aminicenantes bacterium Aminicenantia_JdfR_composite]MCP2597009.1 universal stress protein [Candidatus Aminicenantes bacterium AC-335-G13]MCP2619378.1 universal stress protein [Candidatus Aminicenantes bacterium AC-335-K20]
MSKLIQRIVWATDFSDESVDALNYAELFAKKFNASLFALHVIPDFSPILYNTSILIKGELIKKIDELKKTAKKRLLTIGKGRDVKTTNLISQGNPPDKIVEIAEKKKADLIVLGKRGLSVVEKFFIGSVANRVLRASHIPVLVTKKSAKKPAIKKILIPTDFSTREESERKYAWEIAKAFDADITILHVLELHGYDFPPKILDGLLEAVYKEFQKRKREEKEKIKIKEEVYRAVNAAAGIVDFANTHNYDLIVMSTYTRSALERFFLGSTTEKVVSYSSIPVFVIPPEEIE